MIILKLLLLSLCITTFLISRHEEYKNFHKNKFTRRTKMNKELTPLEWLIDYESFGISIGGFEEEEIKNIELIKKSLKALEIIKNKEVNIHSWHYNDCNKIPYKIYKQSIMANTISSELLTQEEYGLLKEVLL